MKPGGGISVNGVICLVCAAALALSLWYGPSRRIFVSPRTTVTVQSAAELTDTLRTHRIHGRVAVIFTRHLKPRGDGLFPESDYLDSSLQKGTIRAVTYVAPDDVWTPVLSENILDSSLTVPPKSTGSGTVLLHRGGRIVMTPLSRFIPIDETAIVIYEPGFWSPQDRTRIEGFLSSRQLETDLLVIIGGQPGLPG